MEKNERERIRQVYKGRDVRAVYASERRRAHLSLRCAALVPPKATRAFGEIACSWEISSLKGYRTRDVIPPRESYSFPPFNIQVTILAMVMYRFACYMPIVDITIILTWASCRLCQLLRQLESKHQTTKIIVDFFFFWKRKKNLISSRDMNYNKRHKSGMGAGSYEQRSCDILP